MSIKYHVVLINSDYVFNILYTTEDRSECYSFMTDYIKEKVKIDGKSSKAYHEDENTISIYDYHYIMSKSLRCKIVLVEYTDLPR